MDVGQVKSTIGLGTAAADEARTIMVEVADNIGRAQALAVVTRGSSHPDVLRGYGGLNRAGVEAIRVIGLLGTAVSAADAYGGAI